MNSFVKLKIISDELTKSDITSLIGLEGDYAWSKGEYRKNTKIKEKRHGWAIESQINKGLDINSHLRALLDRTLGYEDKIEQLLPKAEILVSCAVYFEETPSLYFDADLIKRMSLIGADFDIDLYDLAE